MKRATLILAVILLAGCENVDRDLYDQVSFRTQESPRRLNPQGSIPVYGSKFNYENTDPATLAPPFSLNEKTALRGKPLYEIYCQVCHGKAGISDTKVALKLDTTPFDLIEEGTKELTDGEIFKKILVNDMMMPNYRNELTDKEAWEITAYVRNLQEVK